jgi:predicted phage terminase large subunit-like protein
MSVPTLQNLPLNKVFTASNYRKTFDDRSLNELAQSIKENGVIEPIIVRPSKKGFEIIAGERRFRASKIAGAATIPAVIRDVADIEILKDGGEQWNVVCLPALAERPPGNNDDDWRDESGRRDGEALCPSRYDRDALLRIKRQLGSYSFAALYQQQPVPSEGGLFKRAWFTRFVERAPSNLNWARGYDLAVSTKTSADYTASVRCAFDAGGNLYLADGFRGRIEYPDQRRYVIGRMRKEKRTTHVIEKAMHGEALVQDIRSGAGACAPLRAVAVEADKYTRALAWANLAEDGKVIIVRGEWNDEFIAEACSFPGGRHDDQIDAVSLAVRQLSRRRRAFGF